MWKYYGPLTIQNMFPTFLKNVSLYDISLQNYGRFKLEKKNILLTLVEW